MNTKERKEKKTASQTGNQTLKVVLNYVIIIVLFGLLVLNYFFVFSSSIYAPWGKYRLDGTFTQSTYYGADNYDLIVILPTDVDSLEIGDIVCYNSLKRGSGKLVDIQNNYLALEEEDGSVIHVGKNSVVGRQYKTVAVLGFFLEFISSYYGIVTFSIILIVYIAFVTFRRINYENTDDGKRLYKMFVEDRRAEAERRRLLKDVERAGDIDVVIHSVIAGNFEENRQALQEFKGGNNASKKEKYKIILSKVYNSLICKQSLTRVDKDEINRVIELMFEAGDFDLDIEFMLVDLILKMKTLRLDEEGMVESAKTYFEKERGEEELSLVGAVLYAIIYKHGEIKNKTFAEIIKFYLSKVSKIEDFQQKPLGLVAENMKKLLKS